MRLARDWLEWTEMMQQSGKENQPKACPHPARQRF
jgi:hypothetical protein